MSAFGPSTQRAMIAVVTASAVGSSCYGWLASSSRGGSGTRSSIPVSHQSSPRAGLWSSGSSSSRVSCTGVAAQPATVRAAAARGEDASHETKLQPLVVCGPSGVGKGTLINMLLEDYPGKFGFSVSHTTRKPRPGEVNGVHYHFSEKSAMQEDIDNSKFIEHANVHANLYGTSISAVQSVTADEKICILDIDIQGVKSVKDAGRSVLDPHYLFIAAPSMETLEARLRGRGTETENALERRLANSKAEMEFGYESGNFEKVLVNDGLEEAYKEFKETVKAWYPQLRGDE